MIRTYFNLILNKYPVSPLSIKTDESTYDSSDASAVFKLGSLPQLMFLYLILPSFIISTIYQIWI